MTRSRTVLIAGAGIGGLAASIALANAGYRAVVFERDRAADRTGAGIQLSPNATRVLRTLGVLDTLLPRACEPKELVVANAINREVLAVMPLGASMREQFEAPYLVCLRADLHEVLSAAAEDHPDIEIRCGAEVSDFAAHSRGVTAQVESEQKTAEFAGAALIGADGIRSKVRARLHPGTSPRHGGMSAWRATMSTSVLPDDFRNNPQVRVWLGPGAHLVHYTVGDGSKSNLVAVTKERDQTQSWGEEASAEDVTRLLPDWNIVPRTIIERAPQFRRWSLFEAPYLTSWGKGAVTLLGDAAHGMFPFIAQGAAAALEDAVALGNELHGADDITAALRRYEQLRLPRTRQLQSMARNIGRIYHMPRPFSFGRDAVMERIGGEGLMRQNAWIYRG